MRRDGAAVPRGCVKICSLREPAHAAVVLNAGADLYGMIFVPGAWRRISTDQAKAIAGAMRAAATGPLPRAVGVFVDSTAEEINATASEVGLDLVQLSGDEPPALLAELSLPAIKAIRPEPGDSVAMIERLLASYADAVIAPIAFLIDGFRVGSHGGEGVRADWMVASELAQRWPLILAGGLTPENVTAAIELVLPLGVDVSSGVETDKRKDQQKIRAFVTNARRTYLEQLSDGRGK